MLAIRAACRLLAALGLGVVTPAMAATPSVMIDVDSGKVLYAERATDPWFPASITKLMTTYVALDMVRSGRARMDQLLTLSAEAASEPPSKMGFEPGTQIRLDNALKIIMVKSANDIARMIGENLGGSVDGYSAMMNETAARIGMKESRWFNQNGLPDDRQQTSARDMAVLGRALLRDFPEHADLFRIGGIKFGRAVMRNHNGLLGRYEGADGMKTGFICSGGFNVVASATRNGRRLIVVVLGHRRAGERDLVAAELFDKGFETSSFGWGGRGLDSLPASALAAPPNLRPTVCGGGTPTEDSPSLVSASNGGNAENAINLLSPSALAFASTGPGIVPRRASLGPRAAFEPIPVWLGATPGAAMAAKEPAAGAAKPVRVVAKPVKTRLLARNARPAPPASAQAFASPQLKPIIADDKIKAAATSARIDAVKAAPKPARAAALQANLTAKPAATIVPKAALTAKPAKKVAAKPAVKPQASLKTKPKPAAPTAKPKPKPAE